jgi:hypothetical protein
MTNRAREFLNRWEFEHVGVVPEERKLREVVQLTMKCRKDAAAAGIPAEELRAAAAQDLIRDMLAAITAANEKVAPASKAEGKFWRRLVGRSEGLSLDSDVPTRIET